MLTQCRWCWAKTANDVSVATLSPLFAPELVNQAATLWCEVPS